MADAYPVTSRNRLRRRHERGHYDHETVHAILDPTSTLSAKTTRQINALDF